MSNLHKIRISGNTEIDEALDDKLDYSLCLKRCSVRSVKKAPTNEDDGYIYTYTLESLDIATLLSEGKTITGKAKSNSKKLRGRAFVYSQDNGLDEEEHYNQAMTRFILYYDEIMDFLKDKN